MASSGSASRVTQMVTLVLLLMMMMSTSCNMGGQAEASRKRHKHKGRKQQHHDRQGGGQQQQQLKVQDIPRLMKKMGLSKQLHSEGAERALFAKDYGRVSYKDFKALWARGEQAKRDEQKLMAAHASDHTIVCNKLLKLGVEAVMGQIFMQSPFDNGHSDPGYAPFIQEHLLKFHKNLAFAGSTCHDAHL